MRAYPRPMRMEPHLVFSGQCEEAFRTYERLLGGTLAFVAYGATPAGAHVPESWRDKVVHATLTLPNGHALLGADIQPPAAERPQGFYLLVALRDAAEADRVFAEFAQGGRIAMPL